MGYGVSSSEVPHMKQRHCRLGKWLHCALKEKGPAVREAELLACSRSYEYTKSLLRFGPGYVSMAL